MKKVLSLFLSVLMLTGVVAAVDLSAYAASSGSCGDKVTWSLSNGTLTISGSGKMYDYSWWNGLWETCAPWKEVTFTKAVIKEGVTSLGKYAFYSCSSVTSISIPNSVTSIGDEAFSGCTSLKSITIPDGVKSIGSGVFYKCTALTSISLGKCTADIDNALFHTCKKLKSITVSSSNSKYKTVDGVLFNKKKTTLICYPQAKTGDSYSVPGTVTKVRSYAFRNCSKLASITIPKKVTKIGTDVFDGCTKLKKISVKSGNKNYFSKDGILYNKEKTSVIKYPPAKTSTSYTTPSTVTKIKKSAFYGCKNLESVKMTDVVTVEASAFYNCTKLSSVKFPNTLTKICEYAFCGCKKLASINLPFKLKTIGYSAFSCCTKLTSVTIPKSVTTLEGFAFDGCSKLQTLTIYNNNIKIASVWNDPYAEAGDDCIFGLDGYDYNVVIKGYSGSVAEKYAKHYGFTFKTLSHTNHNYETKTIKATTGHSGGKYKVCSTCSAYKTSSSYAKINKVGLSTSSYTYNGKAKKPTVTVKDSQGNKIASKYYTVSYINQSTGKTVSSIKNPGKYYVKVKFKTNYSGSLKKAVTIKPKATSIKSISASSNGFTVKWNKQATGTTGYQVQYSTSSKFSSAKTKTISKNSTTSQKVTKLKAKKKYYVRVRTYKTVKINGKNTKIYSAWSSVKGVTTKK